LWECSYRGVTGANGTIALVVGKIASLLTHPVKKYVSPFFNESLGLVVRNNKNMYFRQRLFAVQIAFRALP